MFEQPLYYYEPAPKADDRGDLFRDYEIKNWEITPRIYKIIAAAAIANLLGLFIVGQTSLLTTKGCDSPLVGRVCEVLDTVIVASTLFGTDREYIDAAYEHSELDDSEITFVDVTGMESQPLDYPEGYFQIANPEKYLAAVESTFDGDGFSTSGIPGIPNGIPITPGSGGSLFDTPPNIPQSNPNPIQGTLPEFGGGVAGIPGGRRKFGRGGRVRPPRVNSPNQPLATPTPEEAEVVAEVMPSPKPSASPSSSDGAQADQNGIFINKRPLIDRATETMAKIEAKEIKLDAPFKVTVVGTLGLSKDGKTIILKNPTRVPAEPGTVNDPKMEKLVTDWILSVGDAGWFGYFNLEEKQKIKPKKVTITMEQNDANFTARVASEEPSENAAKTFASSLAFILMAGRGLTDGDEQTFLKSASTTFEGKEMVLKLSIPKPVVQEMFQRQLAKQKAQPRPEGGTSVSKADDSTAKK